MGSYFNDLINVNVTTAADDSNKASLQLAVLETVRFYPPVGGVPYVDAATNIRHQGVVGGTGYDPAVFGANAREFHVQTGDFSYYTEQLLNWANAATPLAGKPGSNHVCPAKNLSFGIVTAFLTALNPGDWEVETPPPIPAVGSGPIFFDSFSMTRKMV